MTMQYIERKINDLCAFFKVMQTSTNTIFKGQVQVIQPEEGYRAAIDPIFLAASLQVQPAETVLDVGAGVGTAMLALAARIPDLKITGLELQRDLVRLANQNLKINGFNDRCEILQGDLKTPPPRLAASSYAHVMANPPYFDQQSSVVSPNKIKALANTDQSIPLQAWVDFCCRMARPKGTVSFIFTADRLCELITAMQAKLGEITIFPLWPKSGRAAKRVIIRGRKNNQAPSRLLQGLVLHNEDGSYTLEASRILNDINPLIFVPNQH